MSLFDEIECKMSLPGDVPEFLKNLPLFQTYDLGQGMNEYEISEQGEIFLTHSALFGLIAGAFDKDPEEARACEKKTKMTWKRKKIHMHASNIRGGSPSKDGYVYYTDDGSDCISINYVVQVRDGNVSSIKETGRSAQPAKKISEMK